MKLKNIIIMLIFTVICAASAIGEISAKYRNNGIFNSDLFSLIDQRNYYINENMDPNTILNNSCTYGCYIKLACGTYNLSSGLSMKNNSVLEGSGDCTIIRQKENQGMHLLFVSNKDNVTIKNLIIDGNSQNNKAATHCIRIYADQRDTFNLRLENLKIMNCNAHGLLISGGNGFYSNNVYISNIDIYNTNVSASGGLTLYYIRNANINNINVNMSKYCYQYKYGSNVNAVNINTYNCTYGAFIGAEDSTNLATQGTLTNFNFVNSTGGLRINYGSDDFIASNGHIENSILYGISTANGSSFSNIQIKNANVGLDVYGSNNSFYGIKIIDSNYGIDEDTEDINSFYGIDIINTNYPVLSTSERSIIVGGLNYNILQYPGRLKSISTFKKESTEEYLKFSFDKSGLTPNLKMIIDSSDNNYNASLYGPTYKYNEGYDGDGVLSFDGVDDNINLTDINYTNTSWSISFWIKVNGSGYRSVWDKNEASQGRFIIWNDNVARFYSKGKYTSYSFTNYIEKWTHVTNVYNGTHIYMYFNGEPVGTPTLANCSWTVNPFKIGSSYANNYFFSGLIDDFRIYNYTISENEIKRIYDIYKKVEEPVIKSSSGGILYSNFSMALQNGSIYDCGIAGSGFTCQFKS